MDYLNENRRFLESVTGKDINLPPILVKFVDEKDFKEIWNIHKCDPFYKDFLELLTQFKEDKRNYNTNNLIEGQEHYFQGLKDVLNKIYTGEVRYCEPIVAFVSDLNFNENIK